MADKREKVIAWILFIILAALFVASFDSGDIDDVCNTNGATLQRNNGTWSCSLTSYGELYYHSESDPLVLNPQGVDNYTQITGMNISNCRGVICSSSGFTLDKNTTYMIDSTFSFTGGANSIYHCAVFKNNVEQEDCEFQRTMGGSTNIGVATISCLKSCLPDESLDVRCKDVNNPVGAMNFYAININVVEIK